MAQTQTKTPHGVIASNVYTDIPASGNTEVLVVDTKGIARLAVELVLSADQNMDAFVVQGRIHPDSSFVTITSAVTATPGGIVIAASGTLASLAASATGWALLDVRAFGEIKFLASAASDGADLTIRARGSALVN